MNRKYPKRCWYCGSRDMEAKDGYHECRECHSTWARTLNLAGIPFTMRLDPTFSRAGTSNVKTPSPSDRILNQAKRAREAQL